MKNNKLTNFIFIFIIIQPLFDVFVYFINNILEIENMVISFIRPLIAISLFLYLYIKCIRNKKKGIEKFYLIYLIIYGILSIVHLLNIKNYFFTSSYGNLINEFRYICNYGYYLLLLMNFDMTFKVLNKEEKNKVLKAFVFASIIMASLYLISIISGTSLETYLYSTKEGWKGWSVSAHYAGHSLTFLLPIVIYCLFEKKMFLQKLRYIILVLILVPGIYLVGTKTPLFAQTIIISCYTIFLIIRKFLKKTKFNKDTLFFVILTTIILITLPKTFGFSNLQNQTAVYESSTENSIHLIEDTIDKEIIDTEVDSNENITTPMKTNEFEKRYMQVISENHDIKLKYFDNRDIQKKLNYDLRKISPVKDKIFGYGHDTLANCNWVETDAWTIYYSYGALIYLIIIIIPFALVAFNGLKTLINIKKMTVSKFLFGVSFGLGVFIIYEVGYTLQFAQTVIYFAIMLILANEIFKESEEKKEKDYLFAINDLNIGGAEVGMVDVINELVSQGKTVDLVLLRKQGPLLEKLNKKVTVYEILNSNYPNIKRKLYHILYMLGGPFIKYIYKKTIPNNYKTEIAYIEGYPAVFIAASNNEKSVKIASIRVGLKNHKLKASKLPWGEYVVKKAYKKIDNIYTVSDLTTQEFIEKYPFCANKTTTIYTYFNIEDIKNKAEEKYDFKFDKTKINFLAVGRFNEQKSYDRLIKAFEKVSKKHKNAQLHFLGKHDTPEGNKIIQLIKEKKLEDKIILHGVKNNPYPYIKDCDVLVSSSLYEGFPRVVNEALCLEKLCIGTNVTGTKEALKDGKLGLLVEDSVEGLIDGMNKFCNNTEIYQEYKKEIKKFDGNKEHYFSNLKIISKKKKNMIIYMPKLSYGGMEKALVNLINYAKLNEKYYLTLYLVYKGDMNYLDLLPKNIKLIIACPDKWNTFGKLIATIKLAFRYIYLIFNQYDIAISYSYQHPILTALTRLSSKNNIVYIHSNLKDAMDEKTLKKRIKKCKYNKFKKIICVSENGKKIVSELINRKQDIYAINNIIDGDKILELSNEKITDFKFEEGKIYFVNICRHYENHKKLTRIINATHKLNKENYQFEVIFIGDGEHHNLYFEEIKRKKIKNIHLIGKKKNPYKYLKQSNCLLLSSISEGYPVVFVESMVLNKPIVTTDVSDASLDVKNKCGIVVPNDDEAIYEGMKEFLEKGYSIKKKFDYIKFNKNIEEQVIEVFEK